MRLRRILLSAALALALPLSFAAGEPSPPERVSIRSHDGFELAARHYSPGKPGGAVLLVHQCDRTGETTGLESLARELARQGLHALELDLRGYGGSRSEAFDGKSWKEAQEHAGPDLMAAYQTLAGLPGVDRDRVAALGASCGGRFALGLARSTDRIKAIVFLSAGFRSEPEFLGEARSLPLLCIAAEEDPHGMTTASMREAFESSEHPSSRLLLLKGDGHGAPLLEQEPRLEQLIIDWLQDRLR